MQAGEGKLLLFSFGYQYPISKEMQSGGPLDLRRIQKESKIKSSIATDQ